MTLNICTSFFGTRKQRIFVSIKGDLIAVTGYLKTRSYIDSNNSVRNIVEIIVDEVDYLGFTKKGIDKSENIPDLDPNHKSQEEYQMIHNALSESEDLPF